MPTEELKTVPAQFIKNYDKFFVETGIPKTRANVYVYLTGAFDEFLEDYYRDHPIIKAFYRTVFDIELAWIKAGNNRMQRKYAKK